MCKLINYTNGPRHAVGTDDKVGLNYLLFAFQWNIYAERNERRSRQINSNDPAVCESFFIWRRTGKGVKLERLFRKRPLPGRSAMLRSENNLFKTRRPRLAPWRSSRWPAAFRARSP